jgi:hypothetical protein
MGMGYHVAPDPGDPGEPQVRLGRVGGADLDEHRRLVSDGAQVLAHGALACPNCQLPIGLPGRIRAARELRCGYCDHTAPGREFLREDVFDTLANEVYLVARVA